MRDFGAGQTIPIHHIIPERSQSDGPQPDAENPLSIKALLAKPVILSAT